MNELTKQYSIQELFSSDSYVIPIYQRNYAWGESEITQLIQDIADYIKKDSNSTYYIGTLIVSERKIDNKKLYETIDGQQRLTTLSILLNLIKNEFPNIDLSWYQGLKLEFASRKNSTNTLQYLFKGESLDNKDCNTTIKQGYEDAKKALKRILNDSHILIDDFCNYFFNKVNILRVLVPEDTDLNHYFEIMNSRGEQLEKHEILKAKCLEILDETDRYAFSLIWEACSNMEKYVQYGFSETQRDVIFGSDNTNDAKWNVLTKKEEVYNNLQSMQGNYQSIKMSIADLLTKNAARFSNDPENENPDRFNSIINFSNFMLHILRIQTKQDITLDDKRLIELFEPFLKDEGNKKEFVKLFGYNLLKGKFLFDKYIIKREFARGTDQWSLKRLKWSKTTNYVNTFGSEDRNNETGSEDSNDDVNRDILMLLSMFHVSASTMVYKHWLNAALNYVFENESTTPDDYKKYLENLAKAYLHKRYISNNPVEYYSLIYGADTVTQNASFDGIIHTDEEKAKLDCGTGVENFIFNYLDYLLWKNYKKDKNYFKADFKNNKEYIIDDDRIRDFEFTFRSSVEHYYPQHPRFGGELKGNDRQWLDNFGNLCLISSNKNSRLSDFMPDAKKEFYQQSPVIDSIKQRIMMEYKYWDTYGTNKKNEIEEHGNKMKELLDLL